MPALQSALELQSVTHAGMPGPQEVVPGQSLSLPQPLQMPPGAVRLQVLMPGQSASTRH